MGNVCSFCFETSNTRPHSKLIQELPHKTSAQSKSSTNQKKTPGEGQTTSPHFPQEDKDLSRFDSFHTAKSGKSYKRSGIDKKSNFGQGDGTPTEFMSLDSRYMAEFDSPESEDSGTGQNRRLYRPPSRGQSGKSSRFQSLGRKYTENDHEVASNYTSEMMRQRLSEVRHYLLSAYLMKPNIYRVVMILMHRRLPMHFAAQ